MIIAIIYSQIFLLIIQYLGGGIIIKKINDNYYNVTIFKEILKNIDLKSEEECEKLVSNIINPIIKDIKKDGIIFIDTYIDANYGVFMKIRFKEVIGKKGLSIRFNFHIDNNLLYETTNYFLKDTLPINSYKIYYYKNKFYILLNNIIDNTIYLNLLENTNIIVDKNDIISKGIKL